MSPAQAIQIVRDLLDNRPEVLEHLRVWAGMEDPFVCSDVELDDAIIIAEGLGLITRVPIVTRDGQIIIDFSASKMND